VRIHTLNYRRRDGARQGEMVNYGFWVYGVPRVIALCRLFGHRPVVDGVGSGTHIHRWVACDRCGIRPEPQGALDPDRWHLGHPYTGAHRLNWPVDPKEQRLAVKASQEPGPWPHNPTGTLGGQLVIGTSPNTGFSIKIGNAGSEQMIAARLGVWPLGVLYLHTESHGNGLQRRLNRTGQESRVTQVSIHDGRMHWGIWAKRDTWSKQDPKWQNGSVRIDPRDILLGERRYSYETIGEPVQAVVRMPHGDDHVVTLTLERRTLARRHGSKKQTWSVDIDARAGIPTKPHGGNVTGFSVTIPDSAVPDGQWVAVACAEAALRMANDRARYGYAPAGDAA